MNKLFLFLNYFYIKFCSKEHIILVKKRKTFKNKIFLVNSNQTSH